MVLPRLFRETALWAALLVAFSSRAPVSPSHPPHWCSFFVLPCCLSLSFEGRPPPSSQRKVEQRIRQRVLPGIWKLTTASLPYELDIRSKLDKRFSTESGTNDESGDAILLKLNDDGTFKQCNEGYREGRWVTGRWKAQVVEKEDGNTPDDNSSSSSSKSKSNKCVLLLLAMNRQYFGPPYDVLLEAKSGAVGIDDAGTVVEGNGNDNETEEEAREEAATTSLEESLQTWKGTVQKGKFLRPSPGKHPFDADTSTRIESTGFLVDNESLGAFSLERALSAASIIRHGRRGQRRTAGGEDDDRDRLERGSEPTEPDRQGGESDGTFFLPHSSSDDGVLQ